MTRKTLSIDFVSDVACPWCAVGLAGLEQALSVLAPGGRLVVLSFHSLEDRPVKQFMRHHAGRYEGATGRPTLRLVRAPKKAGDAELAVNPRARSAILRVAERLPDAEPADA